MREYGFSVLYLMNISKTLTLFGFVLVYFLVLLVLEKILKKLGIFKKAKVLF